MGHFAGCRTAFFLIVPLALSGCGRSGLAPVGTSNQTLAEARKGFQTRLVDRGGDRDPVERPPANIFQIVSYPGPAGKLPAYLTPKPAGGGKHPAMIWITGGDCNSIGDVWSPRPASNDQSASAYRQAGIVMMFPTLRGGNTNPGRKEGFFGEVDDVIAALDYLSTLDYVDPKRIYLGGHSTGGTLVMLVAASTNRFRGVFSFGPVDDVSGYPSEYLPFDTGNAREIELRSPGHWLHSIQSHTYVIEGSNGQSNVGCLRTMKRTCRNGYVQFFALRNGDHFDILAPVNRLIARKILGDPGTTLRLELQEDELDRAMAR